MRFLDEEIPYIDLAESPVHDDPYRPITRRLRSSSWPASPEDEVPIAWWPRDERYAERLAPGTKFADIIGEIDPAKLAGGTSMSAEEALHFGLIPRMHRGIFAMNELPELDELVQVGLFNILEERDVQIRGYPIKFDIDVLILFSANPATYNRSGKVIPQLKDRIGSVIHTHYPRERDLGIQIMEQEAGVDLGGRLPGRGAVLHARDHRADEHRGAGLEIHRPPVGRQRPVQHRQLPHDGGQRPAARGPAGRKAGRAADQRPGPPLLARRSASSSST